ncbi:hypothetical protein ANOM_007550 [Aspergillus nomiae NRRL 13137]|uniref:Uncharacterized protein n=1 Tax=Aspergillus nomiae NRRL (strain ATCC 15546 / NRRL 13137 / CBS 260.88 / M93) TaxID=1509407 RepID=A0A0L1IZ90_ASPN3|nr:uncharacterized protein ANOM_007550 [Aspergillus nomiae NRRL 13137]KNG84822.1 hypothetical protein ANOM_007550 [Aspergillus nomiae NRRL 13137]
MATVAENSGAPPDPQVAGGGGKPPGKRGGGGRKNPLPDRQQDTPCQYCGEYDHTTDEHFERTLQNAINALTGLRRNPQQSGQKKKRQNRPCDYCAEYDHTSEKHFERSIVNAIDALAAPAAQEGGQGRKNKRGRRPPAHERRRQQAAKQHQQQREVEQRPALTLQAQQQPHQQQQGFEQDFALTLQAPVQGVGFPFPMAEQPHPHAHQQGGEGSQVLRHRDEPPCLLPWRMSPLRLRICLYSRTVRAATFKGNAFGSKILAAEGACVPWTGSPAMSSHLNAVLESSNQMVKPRRAYII